jgi:hypothetical protein
VLRWRSCVGATACVLLNSSLKLLNVSSWMVAGGGSVHPRRIRKHRLEAVHGFSHCTVRVIPLQRALVQMGRKVSDPKGAGLDGVLQGLGDQLGCDPSVDLPYVTPSDRRVSKVTAFRLSAVSEAALRPSRISAACLDGGSGQTSWIVKAASSFGGRFDRTSAPSRGRGSMAQGVETYSWSLTSAIKPLTAALLHSRIAWLACPSSALHLVHWHLGSRFAFHRQATTLEARIAPVGPAATGAVAARTEPTCGGCLGLEGRDLGAGGAAASFPPPFCWAGLPGGV